MAQNLYKNKIQTLKETLSQGLLEKDEIISLVLLCMIAGKSVFLYGPPGTAKSLISRRVSCAFDSNRFFDYLMNRFSTPEEVFGPLKLSELRQDRLVRSVEGFLPSADFAFLDEIWKSSPAILNSLLTIINEKQFRNGKENIKVPLRGLVAASNELPQKGQSLEALYDRFIMRLIVPPLKQKANFKKLLQSKNISDKVAVSKNFSNDELEAIKAQSIAVTIPNNVIEVMELLRLKIDDFNTQNAKNAKSAESKNAESTSAKGDLSNVSDSKEPIYISERRWVAVVELLRFCAVLNDRDFVDISDLLLLKHCLWSNENECEIIERLLGESLVTSAPKVATDERKYNKLKKEVELILNDKSICDTETIKGKRFIKFTKTLTTPSGTKTIDIYTNEAHLADNGTIYEAYYYDKRGRFAPNTSIYYRFNLANNECEFFVDENARLYEWGSPHFMRIFDEKRRISLKSISPSKLPLKPQNEDLISSTKDSLQNACDNLLQSLEDKKAQCEAQISEAQNCDNVFVGDYAMILNALDEVKEQCNQLIIETQKCAKYGFINGAF